ncbi:hypothetical protein HGM15179_009330 [Zosterops borbonicus]|uniref:Uncharacterized protein n=1 Tax=Zosterops borbonicus TaxID=364589 RepID=A0A8K1LKR0_9PASS|nr:hypothetical protein HGM15179_009330 [Zosterops borbonicus]
MEVHGVAEIHLQPMMGLMLKQLCPVSVQVSLPRASAGPVALWEEEPPLEQVCWNPYTITPGDRGKEPTQADQCSECLKVVMSDHSVDLCVGDDRHLEGKSEACTFSTSDILKCGKRNILPARPFGLDGEEKLKTSLGISGQRQKNPNHENSWRKATQVMGEFLKKLPVYELLLDIKGIEVMEHKKWIKNASRVWRFLGRKKMVPEVVAGRSKVQVTKV